MADDTTASSSIDLATELTIAWLSNPNTRANAGEVPEFLKTMHAAVEALGTAAPAQQAGAAEPEYAPAVTPRRSLASKDHIISLIDGKPYKTLRRHLSTHGLTPAEYRQRYNLKADYPMVAPSYSEARRSMAQKIGLGRKVTARPAEPAQEAAPAKGPARRGRKPKAAVAAPATKVSKPRGRKPKAAAAPTPAPTE